MMPLRPDSYRPAMPVGRGGFGQGRNHSFRFSRPSALLTVKNANSTKRQSHFVDTLTEEHGSSPSEDALSAIPSAGGGYAKRCAGRVQENGIAVIFIDIQVEFPIAHGEGSVAFGHIAEGSLVAQ